MKRVIKTSVDWASRASEFIVLAKKLYSLYDEIYEDGELTANFMEDTELIALKEAADTLSKMGNALDTEGII